MKNLYEVDDQAVESPLTQVKGEEKLTLKEELLLQAD